MGEIVGLVYFGPILEVKMKEDGGNYRLIVIEDFDNKSTGDLLAAAPHSRKSFNA
jgi:hypothetical protein